MLENFRIAKFLMQERQGIMIMKFYGRETERKKLNSMFQTDGQMISLIYGRRRIGKSELIRQVLKETELKSIYYECKQTTEQNNVDSLSELVGETFDFPKPAFADMESLLRFLFRTSEKKPLILVLDEYPYLRENAKGLDSVLQSVIDEYRDRSNMKLIICGSYVDTMKELLAKQNPLYGRIDLTLNLKPMDYYESALFYPAFSDEDKVRIYSVFGGIPYYNRLIDGKKSVRENIIELIASPGARLENEVSMYLSSEISKITNANEVFEALAKGFSRYKDILDQSHVSSGPALVDVLDKLIRMDVVDKITPINDENNRKTYNVFYISVRTVNISRECNFDVNRIRFGLDDKKDSIDADYNFISDYYYAMIELEVTKDINDNDIILDNDNEFHTLWHSVKLNEDGTYNKIENYENVGTSSDNTHGNVHLEKGETKTITLYYLITDEEFENETLAIDFYIEGSPCKGTLAIIHEPEAN